LSEGSRQILASIGAWTAIETQSNAIHQIHISRRGHFGRTFIDRTEHNIDALGYVTRYGTLVHALSAVNETNGVQVLRPAQITSLDEDDDQVSVHIADGETITSKIAIQAEGGVFGQQAERSMQRDYDQIAIVGLVHVGKPIAHRAFERFTSEGPLALLPQDDGYALVWCVRPDTATTLLALSDTEFLQALDNAFGTRLGKFTRVSPRNSFALGLNAQATATPRTIAIGNAAQTLHPVAGQGLNLGLRDASVLASLLVRESSPAMLTQFLATQSRDRNTTIRLTDIMARVFASSAEGSITQALLGLSLGAIDTAPAVKRLMAQHMMYGQR
jgi:2-octaprenyl-6-methoxyphenol hydroxylase